ncbi:Uncharacterised protein [Klebsiella pneumoniae]|nr:Uncharacterised protein [Klebsiella pneumoniae]
MSIRTTSAELARHHLDGVLAAAGFASDFNPFYIFQNASYPCAHQFVVINKKNVDQRNNLQNEG